MLERHHTMGLPGIKLQDVSVELKQVLGLFSSQADTKSVRIFQSTQGSRYLPRNLTCSACDRNQMPRGFNSSEFDFKVIGPALTTV